MGPSADDRASAGDAGASRAWRDRQWSIRFSTSLAKSASAGRLRNGGVRRFIRRRLDGLLDEPRPGAPRQVSDADVERVMTLTLESTPREATHWSTRAMASTEWPQPGDRRTHLAGVRPCNRIAPRRSNCRRILSSSRKCATSSAGSTTRRNGALVLCATRRPRSRPSIGPQPILPMRPGQPSGDAQEYIRHGTTTLFAALECADTVA